MLTSPDPKSSRPLTRGTGGAIVFPDSPRAPDTVFLLAIGQCHKAVEHTIRNRHNVLIETLILRADRVGDTFTSRMDKIGK